MTGAAVLDAVLRPPSQHPPDTFVTALADIVLDRGGLPQEGTSRTTAATMARRLCDSLGQDCTEQFQPAPRLEANHAGRVGGLAHEHLGTKVT